MQGVKTSKEELFSDLESLSEKSDRITKELVKEESDYCYETYSKYFGGICNAIIESDLDSSYLPLSSNISNLDYIEIENYKERLLLGLLMGDACISNSNYTIRMSNKRFLDWLSSELGEISGSVSKVRESGSKITLPNGRTTTNTKSIYSLNVKRNKSVKKLESWFYKPKKEFPEDLSLSPTVVKMWYVSDGGLNWNNYSRANAQITSLNEVNRREYINRKFEDIGFNVNMTGKTIRVNTSETGKFLNWMGGPPPGFEYKWENKNYFSYFDLINKDSKLDKLLDIFDSYEFYEHDFVNGSFQRVDKIDSKKLINRTKDIFDSLEKGSYGSFPIKHILLSCLRFALKENNCMMNFEPQYDELLSDINIKKEKFNRVYKSVEKETKTLKCEGVL